MTRDKGKRQLGKDSPASLQCLSRSGSVWKWLCFPNSPTSAFAASICGFMALGSVSLFCQDFRSLPAEGKRLCGAKPCVSGVFSSDEPVRVTAALESFLCLWPWVLWAAGTARLGALSLLLHRAEDSLAWLPPGSSTVCTSGLVELWKLALVHGTDWQGWASVEVWRAMKSRSGTMSTLTCTFSITWFFLGWVLNFLEMLKKFSPGWGDIRCRSLSLSIQGVGVKGQGGPGPRAHWSSQPQ